MPYYTDRDGSAMRHDAERRARQMRQRMPSGNYSTSAYSENTQSQEESAAETVYLHKSEKEKQQSNSQQRSDFPLNIMRNLGNFGSFDSDTMLILAILVMVYKDGSNKKLMMALAYLLT